MRAQTVHRTHTHVPRFDGVEVLAIAVGVMLITAMTMMF